MVQKHTPDLSGILNASITGQHLLLGEFVIPKAQNDPTTVTSGVTDGLMQFWISNGRLYLGIYSADLGAWTVIGEEGVGTVKGYVGLAANIPRGWQLADGTNGTFDMRGYFILGSSLEDAGVTAAAVSAVLADHATLNIHSINSHVFTQPNSHAVTPTTVAVQSGSGTTVATTVSLSNNHSGGGVDGHSGTFSHDAISSHAFTANPTPASFTLAFIQKIS